MRPSRLFAPLVVLGTVLLMNCTDDTLIHRYVPLPVEGWARGDTLVFVLPPAPRTADYSVFLGLRHTHRFPYEVLWVEVETRLTPPRAFRRDTLCLAVASPEGTPLGQGVTLVQCKSAPITLHLRRGQGGTVAVHHIMRREVIPEILELGLLAMPAE